MSQVELKSGGSSASVRPCCWDDIGEMIQSADYPANCWIALGAGTYTAWGAANYLHEKDEAVVIIYNDTVFPAGPGLDVVGALFHDKKSPDGLVALHQTFV